MTKNEQKMTFSKLSQKNAFQRNVDIIYFWRYVCIKKDFLKKTQKTSIFSKNYIYGFMNKNDFLQNHLKKKRALPRNIDIIYFWRYWPK